MLRKTAPWLRPSRPGLVPFLLLFFCVVVALSGAPLATAQTVKGAVASSSLETTLSPQWVKDLGYWESQIYPLTFSSIGCPLVEVEVSGVKVSLILDSGTARGFVITNNAPSIPHEVEDRNEERNPDGSHRGESLTVRVTRLSVLGKAFENVEGSLSDWHMFSSQPFNGTVGLDFFLDRRLTVDYHSHKVAVTASSLPEKLDPKRYLQVDLVEPPSSQGHILYARGRVNGRDAVVYFDTGYSVSFISPDFVEGLTRVERPLKFKVFREGVPLELGGHRFILDELRESPISRGAGFDRPVALTLGSDVLSHFIVTIDLPDRKLILARAD